MKRFLILSFTLLFILAAAFALSLLSEGVRASLFH